MANRNQGHNQGGSPRSGTSNRGFASMDAAQQREIARMGGAAVSGNREHMAQIGRKGGEASAESRANARSARARTDTDTDTDAGATGGAPRDPGSRGYADDGGLGRVQNERARGGEVGVGQRGLHARARSDDDDSHRLGASGASGRDDRGRMLGVSNMDKAVERNLAGRNNGGNDNDAASRNLSGRGRNDDQGGNRGLSGRARDADDDGGNRGNRGKSVQSPRGNRDDDN
jgi:general stress protein YciG